MPELRFTVEGVEPLEFAAVPPVVFKLRVEAPPGQPIHSVSLTTQVRIAANQRPDTPAEQQRPPRDAFDRLASFRARRALPSWEAALDLLLANAEQRLPPAATASLAGPAAGGGPAA